MNRAASRRAEYQAATEYLYGLKSAGVKFGIDRMRALSDALGNPELGYPVIHVAGTNGKGSVSAMIDAILHAAGWRTGLYTSPHLVRLGERVQVAREILSEDEIVGYTNELRPVAAELGKAGPDDHPSFFEFMTAMAFLQFRRRAVDVAVVEVGLGGRLDATNVVMPDLSIITSIGFDHCEMLGDKLELIAREKAGIIKSGRPVVIGRLPPEAEWAIRAIAAERGAPLHSVRDVFGEDIADYPTTNMEGEYQRWNAATAKLAARLLPGNWRIDDTLIERGLHEVVWPARWQRLQVGGRRLILDASHNPEGAQVLESNLRQLIAATGRRPIVVTGALGRFRAEALLDVVCRHAREVYLTPPHQARASTYEELESAAPAAHRDMLRRSTLEQIFPSPDKCTLGGPDDVVVLTGSIYLAGEALARIEPDRGANEGKLQDF